MPFTTEGSHVPVIDVHFHYFMPEVLGPMKEFVIATPEERQAAMEKLHARTIIYSPVIWTRYNSEWSAEKWAELCRKFTDHQAAEVAKAPASVGSFAPLPFPHVVETIEALKYAEERCAIKPDGYAITTSAANKYLGDASYDQILAECNRRGVSLPLSALHPNAVGGQTLQHIFGRGNIYIECSQGTAAQTTMLKSLGICAQNVLMGSDWPFTGKGDVSLTLDEMKCITTLSTVEG
ncbi:hypothetical protein FDECE_13026 [Fusarium decemcellulare]|nr:hypothetical protein FDECE_13026 [Fusarium decemcellulare]